MASNHNSQLTVDFQSPKVVRYNQLRKVKDYIAKYLIAIGGVSVIAAILLIFMYLLYEVVPLFQSAKVKPLKTIELTTTQSSLYMAIDEQNDLVLRLLPDGTVTFTSVETGQTDYTFALPLPVDATVTSFALNSDESREFAVGLSNGQVIVAKHNYKATYPNDVRVITPYLSYPFGEGPIDLFEEGVAVEQLGLRDGGESLTLAASHGQTLKVKALVKEEDFIMETVELVPEDIDLPQVPFSSLDFKPKHLLIDVDSRSFYVQIGPKSFAHINLQTGGLDVVKRQSDITDMAFLLGDISLLVSEVSGTLSQWFLVREDGHFSFKEIRDFKGEPTSHNILISEHRRKGFAQVSSSGQLELFHATAHRDVYSGSMLDKGDVHTAALSPRGDRLVIETTQGELKLYTIKNKHPEVSWSALWDKVWYESYDEPKYVWQSSSSSNDFEPKMSLMPLSFGTLKAAFYAMMLGAPLAILGAIYTAYFMTPVMRRKIKPLIELMEALPTVILGFLAGLWLAPFMEKNLAAIFSILLMLPIGVIAFGFGMSRLPLRFQNVINQGWHGFILIPVILVMIAFCIFISPAIEYALFGGNMKLWLTNDLGIPFDQRNALVVGIAMGFAVIPTIFSIAEDAIFSVPKHLSYGSLALGATPWQTMVGVVLPTASPGIFSGLMIGLGRAVGETMIVLMATGNTPIMDINIFEGMRTLAANLAVEVPEAEVDSTHYRVLFLAAFVLFLFTFVVNTIAELVRQNLRKKYGSL